MRMVTVVVGLVKDHIRIDLFVSNGFGISYEVKGGYYNIFKDEELRGRIKELNIDTIDVCALGNLGKIKDTYEKAIAHDAIASGYRVLLTK